MSRLHRPKSCVAVLLALVATVAGCDGNGNGNSPPGPGPGPRPSPGTNPCASVADLPALVYDDYRAQEAAAKARWLAEAIDHSSRWRVLDDLYAHRAAARRTIAPARAAGDTVDIGEIAVLQNRGDLILPANRFDLGGSGLRFTRNAAGGYSVVRTDAAFRGTLGTRLTLTDDDSRSATVAFAFPFYGQQHTTAFVNSDGNVTFVEEDRASTERNVSRLLTGPPRIAPFLADLDPSAGGSVWVNSTSSEFTVTWCGVRGFDSPDTATLQVTLMPDGTVEMKYDSSIALDDAVVGVSPGRTGEFRPIDLSAAGPTDGGSAAVGERFSDSSQLDTVATARRFYESHSDQYDQLVIWTDTRVITDAFAFETTVANNIRGIGQDVFDLSSEFGSAGALSSIVVMDALTKYPDDPRARALRENSTLSLLGHETGHRWLALLEFRDHNGQRSQALLGRDQVHWSFFFDSDASFLEGNDIEDLGGGAFRTRETVSRYSRLDLYAMGLARGSEVPEFFYVESPTNTDREPASPPTTGVRFNGTRRVVLLQDVQAIHGPRRPSADASPRVHRQAFIYIITTAQPSNAQVAKLDRIRQQWEPFFFEATERRMRVETALR